MLTKLTVDYQVDGNYYEPSDRIYTLTHCDDTGERILFVGDRIDHDRIDILRDEVEGRWVVGEEGYDLNMVCNLYSEYSKLTLEERYEKFKSHMLRVLTAVINGDREFIEKMNLTNGKIVVDYVSKLKIIKEYEGRVGEYLK